MAECVEGWLRRPADGGDLISPLQAQRMWLRLQSFSVFCCRKPVGPICLSFDLLRISLWLKQKESCLFCKEFVCGFVWQRIIRTARKKKKKKRVLGLVVFGTGFFSPKKTLRTEDQSSSGWFFLRLLEKPVRWSKKKKIFFFLAAAPPAGHLVDSGWVFFFFFFLGKLFDSSMRVDFKWSLFSAKTSTWALKFAHLLTLLKCSFPSCFTCSLNLDLQLIEIYLPSPPEPRRPETVLPPKARVTGQVAAGLQQLRTAGSTQSLCCLEHKAAFCAPSSPSTAHWWPFSKEVTRRVPVVDDITGVCSPVRKKKKTLFVNGESEEMNLQKHHR